MLGLDFDEELLMDLLRTLLYMSGKGGDPPDDPFIGESTELTIPANGGVPP